MATKSLKNQVKDLTKQLSDFPKEINRKAGDIIAENMILAESEAKLLTPVHTGRLRANNRGFFDKFKASGVLFNNVVYAPFVNFGTGSGVNILKGWVNVAKKFKGKNEPFKPFQATNFFSIAADNASKKIINDLTELIKNAKL